MSQIKPIINPSSELICREIIFDRVNVKLTMYKV